jgi:hypothetical protein
MTGKPRQPRADFVIHLVADDLRPWVVPLRSLTRVLNAVQRLIEHTDREGSEAEGEAAEDETKQPLHLLTVRAGSAAYSVSAVDGPAAVQTLADAARSLEDPDHADWNPAILSSIEDMSAVAKSLHCTIEFSRPGENGATIARVTPGSYDDLSKSAFAYGEGSVSGYLERVGGATKQHCGIRLPDQPSKMVICPVATDDLIRRLGQYVYQNVHVSGTVTWLRRSWRVKSIYVKDFEPFKSGSVLEALERIYRAGGKDWDNVTDPDALIAEMRGS